MGFFIEMGLSGMAAVFAWRLSYRAARGEHLSPWLWSAGFATLGAGVLIVTLFQQVLWLFPRLETELPFTIGYALQLLANALMLSAVIVAYCGERMRLAALTLVVAKLSVLVVLLGYRKSFDLVIFDTAFSALPLLALCAYGAWTWRYPHAQWIVVGAFVLLFATLFHQGRVVRGAVFTANDLYHLMQIASMLLFARGAWNMQDAASSLAKLAFKRVQWRS